MSAEVPNKFRRFEHSHTFRMVGWLFRTWGLEVTAEELNQTPESELMFLAEKAFEKFDECGLCFENAFKSIEPEGSNGN